MKRVGRETLIIVESSTFPALFGAIHCLLGREGVDTCVFTVIMVTNTQFLCVCVWGWGGFFWRYFCLSDSLCLFLMFTRH